MQQEALVRAGQQSGDCHGAGARTAACPSWGFGVIALPFHRIRRAQPHGETARLLGFGGSAAGISAVALVRAASPSPAFITVVHTHHLRAHSSPSSQTHQPFAAGTELSSMHVRARSVVVLVRLAGSQNVSGACCAHRPDWRRCARATTATRWRWTVRRTDPLLAPPALPTSPIPLPRWADQRPDQRVRRVCMCNRRSPPATAEQPHQPACVQAAACAQAHAAAYWNFVVKTAAGDLRASNFARGGRVSLVGSQYHIPHSKDCTSGIGSIPRHDGNSQRYVHDFVHTILRFPMATMMYSESPC